MRILFLLLVVFILSCQLNTKNGVSDIDEATTQVNELIKKGDSIYALKADYGAFAKSLDLYDSAWKIAFKSKNETLVASSIFAKGRAYDAVNSNPQRTIEYYKQAAAMYAKIPVQYSKSLYIKHLVAHAYDKIKDSINCVTVLQELFTEISSKPDTLKQSLKFVSEMALISTEVGNYKLAAEILSNLTTRSWIKNDKLEYDYLNHYYISKARIDVLGQRKSSSVYMDSLKYVLTQSKNLSDSMYYTSMLFELNKALGDSAEANRYLALNQKIFNTFNTPENIKTTNSKLMEVEVSAVEAQLEADREKSAIKQKFIYALIGLLLVISILTIIVLARNREIRRKQNEVEDYNKQLQHKNLQNELLNKEIHHRVKNNLQMIMSLVNMQEYTSDKDEVKESLQTIGLRIESIAKLHEQLMEQTDKVDLKNYVHQLVTNLSVVIGDGKQIMTHLQIEPIAVSQKISFPLGLIINEWITNSIKYAQPKQEILALNLKIESVGENIELIYEDNGVPQLHTKENKSLGLSIVNLLIQQLEGKLDKQNENNFKYKLTIPNNNG